MDGTLLPLNEDEFSHAYFKLLAEHMEPYGYTKDEIINFVNLGVRAMYLNNGTKTNEEVFLELFFTIQPLKEKLILKLFLMIFIIRAFLILSNILNQIQKL